MRKIKCACGWVGYERDIATITDSTGQKPHRYSVCPECRRSTSLSRKPIAQQPEQENGGKPG